MRVLLESIVVREMRDKEVGFDEGNILDMDDNEKVMVPEEINDDDFGGACGNEVPFVSEIANKKLK